MKRTRQLVGRIAVAVLWIAGSSSPIDAEEAPAWTQSRLAYAEESGLLFVAHRDASRVVALDHDTGAVRWDVAVGTKPRNLDVAAIGATQRLFVSCETSGEVLVLDPATGTVVQRLPVGPGPRGFAVFRDRFLAVALHPVHRVAVWDLVTEREVASLPSRFPTAVAAVPQRQSLYVTRFYEGTLDVFDWRSFAPRPALETVEEANQLSALVAIDDGATLLLPHITANTDQPDLHLANTIFPVLSRVPTAGEAAANSIDLAFIGEVVNGPEAAARLPGRDWILSANSRSNDLSLVEATTLLSAGLVEVGNYPDGVVTRRDESRAYVVNAHDHTVSVIHLDSREEVGQWRYGEEQLSETLATGRDLFHDAHSLRLVLNQWMSCSNCHPEGGTDGRVWSLPGKPPLRTKDLHDFAATRPGGWMASFDEMQDEEIFIREFFLGLGLSESPPHRHLDEPNEGLSADLDALSAYVYSLRTPLSPHLVDGELSPSAARGRRVFESAKTGCLTCHPSPTYTNSQLGFEPPALSAEAPSVLSPDPADLPRVDVPSLRGLYAQPQYLHDARTDDLSEIFTRWNAAGLHGETRHLSTAEIADLEAFLLSLPFEVEELPVPAPLANPVYKQSYSGTGAAEIEPPAEAESSAKGGYPQADDRGWTGWRGPRADGMVSGSGLPIDQPSLRLDVMWRRPLGAGFSGIAARRGVLFTAFGEGDTEFASAIEADGGREIWRHPLGPTMLEGVPGGGPRATPTLDGDRVFFVGSQGDLWCLDAATGEPRWHHRMIQDLGGRSPMYGVTASVVLLDGVAFYNSAAGDGASLLALDAETGAVLWRSESDGPSYSTPTIGSFAGRPQVIFFTADGVVGVSPRDGEALWRREWTTFDDANAVSPILDGNTVFISSGSGSVALDIGYRPGTWTATDRYVLEDVGQDFTTSILHQGSLYGVNGSRLQAIDFATGEVHWSERGFQLASLVGLDQEWLLALTYHCRLVILELDPTKANEIANFDAPFDGGRCLTVPTVTDETIFLRTESELVALTITSSPASPEVSGQPAQP